MQQGLWDQRRQFSNTMVSNIKYPDNKDFIFTVFDDTDVATVDYIRPIYDTLSKYGLKTTKSVWPISYNGPSDYLGSHTLQNTKHLDYIVELYKRGFEIAFHGATMESSKREDIEKSFHYFKKVLGFYPRSYSSHSSNRDNLYWGKDRFSIQIFKYLYSLGSMVSNEHYGGHVKGSEFFWGDLALKHIEYVRNFTFYDLNILNVNVPIPYKNLKQSYVNYWFVSADAENVEEFNAMVTRENIDKLIKERGVCILSTHFGKGFIKDGKLNSKTDEILKYISEKNGWFVPVSTALDFLKSQQRKNEISRAKLFKLEFKWFLNSFIRKKENKLYEPTELEYLNAEINEK